MNQKSNMHVGGESNGRTVPTKCPNKDGKPLAEGMEGRRPTKENVEQTTAPQTQSWVNASSGLLGVREVAKRERKTRFTALLHHVTPPLLLDSFYALKRDAAPGVDGVTWKEYETDLDKRLENLHSRVHQGTYRAQPSKTTISKVRGIMHRIYKVGILHELVAKNPLTYVETRSKSTYRAIIITPAQTVAILKSLPSPLHYTLVLTCAATALRSSEILALRRTDMLWHEGRIQISKRWAKGKDGETKTAASEGYVPLHPVLAAHLRTWQHQTPHAKETDFVFPPMRAKGRKPLCSSVFVADHLRPAAKKAGVLIQDGQRFGLHNLRHSLSNWLVNKAKVEPKTVQGILRHAKIQTTLDLYTQEDSDETRAAQGEFLSAVGMSTTVN